MSDSWVLDALLSSFDVSLSQNERLLTLEMSGADFIPHRLVGEERMSRPFAYTLDCISQNGDIELKTLMAQPAALSVRQADGSYRKLSGLVESAALLGEDGGVFYYQLTLVPWLSMLKLGRDSRIFQDLTAVEVIESVFSNHAIAQGEAQGGWRLDLRREYPARSYCVQYRESDFQFVNRLMEQEGLFYYFEHASDDSDFNGHRLVITDDVATCAPVEPQVIRFHRQDATELEDSITQWSGRRQQQPTRVSLGTFDYKQPGLEKRSGQDTRSDQGNLSEQEVYDYPGEYYFDDHSRGERLTVNRLEAHESRAKRFYGAGGTRQLKVGRWFELSQHARHEDGDSSEREFLVLGLTVCAENALPVSAHLKALPGSLQARMAQARQAHGLNESAHEDYADVGTGQYLIDFESQRLSQPYRPSLDHPRPNLGGPQTAIVVGPENEEIHTDSLNRVRVQFHWDRSEKGAADASCWLRVAQPNAGAGWGSVFVPRIGQEVIVDFLEGDADRPLITGRVYNGDQAPQWHSNGLLSGLKSKTYRGNKYNELVFDDATDQERVRLNSEHEKSQLNLGYLIHQQGNTRGSFRGTGFELRSDAYGAIRANSGLMLSSWGQIAASGEQLDLSPAHQQLASAYQLANTLSDSATSHNAEALAARTQIKQASDDTQGTYGADDSGSRFDGSSAQSATNGGRGQAARLNAPWLHLTSPAGIATSTPESTHLAQGRSLSVTSGEDINLATGRSLVGAVVEKFSLFVQRSGIKLFAGKGKVEVQAQSDAMDLTAEKDVTITSTENDIDINAAKEILLTCGGAYVRLKGGNIELHAPGKIDVKGAQHSFGGPTSLSTAFDSLPESKGPYEQYFTLRDKRTEKALPYASYRVETAEGDIIEGRADSEGRTQKILTLKPEKLKATILDRFDDAAEGNLS
ncbi:type VI secretion system tip protein TssI/VgrG [Cobetia marina]|uniref:Type VI secretion system tip protein TssI/VgrG n=1 Tax=Cobetia marina TaxID=28258 RepID=A0ABU9GD02_COBMA